MMVPVCIITIFTAHMYVRMKDGIDVVPVMSGLRFRYDFLTDCLHGRTLMYVMKEKNGIDVFPDLCDLGSRCITYISTVTRNLLILVGGGRR